MIQGALSRAGLRGRWTAPGALHPAGSPLGSGLVLQLGVALYGGYFGAGIGILMLRSPRFPGDVRHPRRERPQELLQPVHQPRGGAYFIVKGAVVWPAALVIVSAPTLGGYARRQAVPPIGRGRARTAVVVIGLVVTALLFWQQAGR